MATLFQSAHVKELRYSEFLDALKNNQVSEVKLKGKEISGTLTSVEKGQSKQLKFKTTAIDPSMISILSQVKDLKYSAEEDGTDWLGIAQIVLPILFIWIVISSMINASRGEGGPSGGLLSVGRSRARVYMEKEIKVTFDDVAGVDEAKEELQEIVTFLKEPERYRRLGGRLPKGVLLVGPPGTGKTLLARAVAGEARVPFFSISGSEFVELFVGVGAARVRDLFVQAKAKAPCIIFIDELDALGRARGISPITGGHDEKEQTLNQLLAELDGFDSVDGVILLAATNRPEILDSALLRAGRFDRQVLVDRPDKVGRSAILKVHLKGVSAAKDVVLDEIAALTTGFSGADLANLVNESTLLAARRNATEVSKEDMVAAFERIVAGLEKKNRLLNSREREVVAFHEMGHAIVALSLDGEPIQKVSIIPRGIGALGYTLRRPIEDRFLMSKLELENKMTVLMGGRAAECLIFNVASTGASDDFAKATEIARNMVTRYGMVEQTGMVSYAEEQSPLLDERLPYGSNHDLSEKTKNDIDAAVKDLVHQAYERASEILIKNSQALHDGAELLLQKETISEEELNSIYRKTALLESKDKELVPLAG
jgi:cell division protease FtsH